LLVVMLGCFAEQADGTAVDVARPQVHQLQGRSWGLAYACNSISKGSRGRHLSCHIGGRCGVIVVSPFREDA
jgi:hypothetical protein